MNNIENQIFINTETSTKIDAKEIKEFIFNRLDTLTEHKEEIFKYFIDALKKALETKPNLYIECSKTAEDLYCRR